MLKRAFYYWTWFYVRLTLAFYYRRILIRGRPNIPRKGAVMFAVNHQNALIDPLLVATATRRHMHFLMRADLFRKKWMSIALSTLNMMPVFRLRDGWQSLDENKKTFERTTTLFRNGEALLIFPEGSHAAVRRVRPLSRGFTKVVFEALQSDPGLEVSVVPVGLNYTRFHQYYGSVCVFFGVPIPARQYFREPLSQSANRFRDAVHNGMCKVTSHLWADGRYEELLAHLGPSGNQYLDPEAVNARVAKIAAGSAPTPVTASRIRSPGWLVFLVSLPFILINWLPLLIWRYLKKSIKDPVFTDTRRFAIGLVVVPIYYAVVFCIASQWLSWGYLPAMMILLLVSLPALGTLRS
jgi:1-acyl-sn-glycerol-3-phosphate acyltransferase